MKNITIGLAGLICFLLSGSVASANTTQLSSNPSYAAQPFSYYCHPYLRSFETDKHYVAQNGGCAYSVPNAITGSVRGIALYKGVPGTSTFVAGDQIFGSPTLVQEDNTFFGAPVQEDQYFAVIYGANTPAELAQFGTAFTVGSSTNTLPPNNNYQLLRWKWGAKPASEYEPVVVVPGILGSWQKNGEWVVDPILHTYDNLIDTFLANGYVENQTLFRFGYDWEEPNETSAYLLGKKIQEIKKICGCSQVDIVAHSMGGLVSLYYIENGEYKNDVDQLFLVATPISGAPKAYKTWEGGEVDFGDPRKNLFMQTKFWLEARRNGYTNVYNYIRNAPIESIHELLPVYNNYLSTATTTLEYSEGYPVNGFLETLIAKLNQTINKVRINAILADNLLNDTTSGFVVKPSTDFPKWEHGEPTQTLTDAGDGTVPRISIENIFSDIKEFDGVDHTEVASTSSSYIFKELNNKEPNSIIGTLRPKNIRLLLISLFSPIDMQIIAPDGKRLGKDFTTNTEINEIPGAFYSGFNTDDEYAVIVDPLPGTYSVKTVGTGSGGEYTIVTDYITNATTTEAETIGSTTPAQIINHIVTISSTSTTVTITKDIPPPPPAILTPDTCITDIQKAYQDKWISKKAVYEGLIFDCKALKTLFKTRDMIENVPLNKRTKAQKATLAATYVGIKLILAHMDLLAKDKTNTQDAVLLIHSYTTWSRQHEV